MERNPENDVDENCAPAYFIIIASAIWTNYSSPVEVEMEMWIGGWTNMARLTENRRLKAFIANCKL